jgi:hypothetical protein
MTKKKEHLTGAALSGLFALLLMFQPCTAESRTKPSITITQTPPYDEKGGSERMAIIKGNVQGSGECKDCKVVLFARTNTWWVQPIADSPDTVIVDGKFESETHLGSAYAAVLVRSSYKAPATTFRLPNVGGEVLAVDVKEGSK